jgi:hypothetical protein
VYEASAHNMFHILLPGFHARSLCADGTEPRATSVEHAQDPALAPSQSFIIENSQEDLPDRDGKPQLDGEQ